MTASPYASDAKIAEAVAVIEAEYVGTREQTLLQQIFIACALGGGGFPGDAYLTPDSSADYRTPDGSDYYATP